MSIAADISYIMPGEMLVFSSSRTLRTTLGSCIAVCLYDSRLKIGGMNHFMYSRSSDPEADDKYGDHAVPSLIRKMLDQGCRISDLKASLVGGAAMTHTQVSHPGLKNIKVAEEVLKTWGIPVVLRNVGGSRGRRVRYSTDSGHLEIKFLDLAA